MQSAYRQAIRTQGMVEDLVRHLSNDNEELKMHCASAIFKVQHTLSFFD